MGGTDDPSNLIELSVEEHAEAHRLLWEQHGKKQDYCAWQALLKQMDKQEVRRELCRLGAQMTNSKYKFFANPSPELIRRRVEGRKNRPGGYNSPEQMAKLNSPEALKKRKEKYAQIGHAQGDKNSQYGTCWITNGEENKKIKKEDLDKWLEIGYYKGRVMRA